MVVHAASSIIRGRLSQKEKASMDAIVGSMLLTGFRPLIHTSRDVQKIERWIREAPRPNSAWSSNVLLLQCKSICLLASCKKEPPLPKISRPIVAAVSIVDERKRRPH